MSKLGSQVWCATFLIPAFRRLRLEDCKFKASLGSLQDLASVKKLLRAGSVRHLVGRMLTLNVLRPEFDPQYCIKLDLAAPRW